MRIKIWLLSTAIAVLVLILTAVPILATGNVTELRGVATNNTVSLTWINGAGATSTMVRYSTTAFPANTGVGTLGYSGGGKSCIVSGLTAGNTYYFSVWNYDGATYSATAAQLLINTTLVSGLTSTDPLPTPDAVTGWLDNPDASGLTNLAPLTTIVEGFLSSWGVPANNGWMAFVVIIIVGISILIYVKTHGNLFISMAAAECMLLLAVLVLSFPSWFLFIPACVAAGAWGTEKYYQ